MKERRTKLPFTEPCGNGLLRFNNWDGTQLSTTKGGGGEKERDQEEERVKDRGKKKKVKKEKEKKTAA